MARTRTSGQGRPKGALNKDTRDIREMVTGALVAVGGAEYLAEQAIRNPTAFMGLIGRVLPLQVAGDKDRPLVVDFRWADKPDTVVVNEVTKVIEATIEQAEDTPQVVWQDDNAGK